MKLSVAGSTTMPVKIGMNSQTRLTKKRQRQPGRRREHRAWPRRRAPAATRCAHERRRATSSPSSVTSLTRGSSRCSSPRLRGDVLGEHAPGACTPAAPVDRLLDEAALPCACRCTRTGTARPRARAASRAWPRFGRRVAVTPASPARRRVGATVTRRRHEPRRRSPRAEATSRASSDHRDADQTAETR